MGFVSFSEGNDFFSQKACTVTASFSEDGDDDALSLFTFCV